MDENFNFNNTPRSNGEGMGIAALICGILGLIGGWIPFVNYFTTVLSLVAIILGAIGRKNAPDGKNGMATAGMVLGIISFAIGILGIFCLGALCAAALA